VPSYERQKLNLIANNMYNDLYSMLEQFPDESLEVNRDARTMLSKIRGEMDRYVARSLVTLNNLRRREAFGTAWRETDRILDKLPEGGAAAGRIRDFLGDRGTGLIREVDARVPYREAFIRPGGTVAGPVLMSLADFVIWGVVMSLIGDIMYHVIDPRIDFAKMER